MVHLWDSFVVWLMWFKSSLKAPPPPPATLQDERWVSSTLISPSVPLVWRTNRSPKPSPRRLHPHSCRLGSRWWILVSNVGCSPGAAAAGPPILLHKRGKRPRLWSTFMHSHPAFFSSLSISDEGVQVMAMAFVSVLCWWGSALHATSRSAQAPSSVLLCWASCLHGDATTDQAAASSSTDTLRLGCALWWFRTTRSYQSRPPPPA